jgi:two-component system LytT family response regulator
MYKAIIIDDEENALEMLEWQIKNNFENIEVVALCNSADAGIAAIKKHKPELVFLDIEMPNKNGFEVLNAFDEPAFDVIFTTAYNQFAIKAFKFAAFDYLLKPIDVDDLKEAVSRYGKKKSSSLKDQFKLMMEQYSPPQTSARIALNTADGMIMVKPDMIVRCQSLSNYTRIFLDDGKSLVVTKTLKEVEETLSNYSFYRIHNSHFINLNHIQRYVKQDGGYVVMTDNEEIAIARNRKDGFMEHFARI